MTIGERFANALAAKDDVELRGLFADDVDFRALTPNRDWQAATPGEVIDDVVLGHWFEPSDHITGLESVSTGQVADREHVAYRPGVSNADGHFLVEQQAYYTAEQDKIRWMRVLCSGYRPVELSGSEHRSDRFRSG